MSGFSVARAASLARREGISYEEACRRLGRLGAAVRRARRRQCACVSELTPPTVNRLHWWHKY